MSGGVAPTPLTTEKPILRLTHGLLSFHNINAVALTIILAFSGMIGAQDLAFVLLSFFYMFFIAKFAFPTLSKASVDPPIFADHGKILNIYVSIGAIIGLVLPVAYMLHGVLEGDKEGIKAAAPHVFLLASQVFMESVTFSGGFSLPVRVFVPVVYNSMRMSAILEWVKSEFMKVNEGEFGSEKRLLFGRVLAMVNMVFWGFNLFGFLLPVYLPKAFKKYYASSDESKDS
ncbi:hypothetical protein CTI12_AA072170 [Artemisia annua]|uniref:DUF7733 domain-containing protein n=1 Tax=Artemisia annua TaxID=35608 RepID=A0A2U1Q5W6_ARTAN|nr:hypothetical protein CTI12_AA072170 [Artemisia annua]